MSAISTRWDRLGYGRELVVLAGSLGSDHRMWDRTVPALLPFADVMRFDYPGHGGSEPDPIEDIDVLARRVASLLRDYDAEAVHFVGLSIGGSLGLALAARHGDLIKRLVVMCTSAHYGGQQQWLDRAETVTGRGTSAISREVVGRWFTGDHVLRCPGDPELMTRMIDSVEANSYAALCRLLSTLDLRPELATISAPTLVIGADADRSTPLRHQQQIHAAIPGSRLEVLPGAHLVPYESPEPVNQLLTTHLFGAPGEGGAAD